MLENEGSTAETSDNEPSMDDTLRDTLAAIRARGAEIPEEPAAPAPEAAPESAEEKAQRLRDEQGRFAAKQQEPETPAAPVTPEPAAPAAPVVVPPELQRLGLRKEEAEAYMAAPKVLQDAMQRRIDETLKGADQYKTKAQFADSIQTAIAPHMQTIQSLGVTPEVAISELMKVDNVLRHGSPEQKQHKFMELARDYGIELPGVEIPQVDPALHAMQQQLRQIEQRFQTQEQQREQQALNSQLAEFAADPNHSHFEAVRGYMGALIQAGHAPDLKSAYEQAVWANPVTRASVLAQQQATQRAEADQKAKAAKEAASVNVRAKPSLPSSEPIGTMEDTIRATLRRLQAA